MGGPEIEALGAGDLDTALDAHARLLHACVHAGASVNFVMPFPLEEAAAFWRDGVLPPLRAGRRVLFAAGEAGQLLGAVQLELAAQPNQAHRAEVTKLLVHPGARRRGIATALMHALENRARAEGRSLITLDTRTGDAAEHLYAGLGYVRAGEIPGYCRHPVEDRLESTTLMYKPLGAAVP